MRKFISLSACLLLGCIPTQAPASPPDDRPQLVLQTGPEESVTSVAVSPDGALVATGSFDGRARIYDARTGALVRAIGTDSSRGVRALAFSPDGKRLACGGLEMDKTVKLWDPRTGALVQALAGHKASDPGNLYAEIYTLAFSPDGKLLATGGRDKVIHVWDLEAGKLRQTLAGNTGEVGALAFAPDGKTLAGGGGDKTVRLWDVSSGRLLQSFEGHRDWVCALAFTPDGKTLASGSCDWSFHRGRDSARFERPGPKATSEWRLWDVASGRAVRAETGLGRIFSLAIAPDGAALACGVGKEVRLYDLRKPTPARVVTAHDSEVTAVAITPDGKGLVSGGHDRTARRASLADGRIEWRAPGYWEQVNAVALSTDGALLVTGSGDLRARERSLPAEFAGLGPGAVRLWDARTGRLTRRLGDPAEQVMSVAISPDGRRVAAGGGRPGGKGIVRVWDAKTGAAVWSKSDHAADVLAVAFSADGSVFATAGADGIIRLCDPATGAVKQTLDGHEGGATSVAFLSDGTHLVGGSADGSASLWNVKTGKRTRTFRPAGPATRAADHVRRITSVTVSPDGGMLATCSASADSTYGDRIVRIWDVRTGDLKREIATSQTAGRFVVFSPDGTTLATSGTGKAIALYDVRTGKLIGSLVGHGHPPPSVAFSADGRRLVSGGDFRTAKIWDVATERSLVTLVTFAEGRPGTDDWLATTADGFYEGSPGIDRFLAWRVGTELRTGESLGTRFHNADRVAAALGFRTSGSR